ncbi:MAG: bifunctional DNA-formamidopyrimidine glycosylase/DNA-(apurinic or apyrimidinic site) lyase [Sulfobacillus thermotolerans]|uniref:Formamidopyrimidine-DNA glycosylase n=1 Tax=Sulfobacillus thermotolerans TaxID=338644 RepID=A0ABN5GY12_9FIRM|nr:DNA-formamidopyrimidine glycosylase [Sulfobacillus thermotolerans]MCY0907372.1 bifunctional DNA-formamidopyrimidine glycosylase/DNA-(apurinic or apyrimidinic site) lyase [Sulfobacillus thermotolerans]
MPELPEVETIRFYLTETVLGQRVNTVKHLDQRMVKTGSASAEEITRRLPGRMVKSIKRRGKFLFLEWDTQDHLLVHLGMSGRLIWIPESAPWVTHTHMVLGFRDFDLRLSDPRRFGRIGWLPAGEEPGAQLGVEPLGRRLTRQFLAQKLKGRSAPIKALLLDQRIIAGLGNIYVDESLFQARIRPDRPGSSLTPAEITRMIRAIRAVLKQAIMHRGTTFSDYVDALGHPGENQAYLWVYGRSGQECRRCGHLLAQQVIAGRTSHFCGHCQS